MAYAQKDYPQIQGIDGRYKISSIGCFLTAFCNLEEAYGKGIDPLSLNNELVARNIYIDIDDGVRDDLGWSSISNYDPTVVVTGSSDHGTNRDAGWPNTNEAIVRFYYESVQSGQMIFHFCKVYDAANHLIVDSWDGQVKTSPYGEPTGWATYQHSAPVPVAPPPEPPAPKYEVTENYSPAKQVQLNKQPTYLWGMNYDFDFMKDHPVETHDAGEVYEVTNKVHHQDGYDYYRRDGQVDGFNVLDCDDYTPPPPPPPTPTAPPAAPIPIPLAKTVQLVAAVLGYQSANDANKRINKDKAVPLQPGKYYVYSTSSDNEKVVNLSAVNGKDGSWVNLNDNVEPPTPAPEPPAPGSTVAPDEPSPNVPVSVPNHDLWKTTYQPLRADRQPVLYVSINDKVIKIYDLDQRRSAIDLLPYTELHIVGKFEKDGVTYARAKKVADNGYWYGIPLTILNTYDQLYAYAPKKAPKLSDYSQLVKEKIKKLIHDVTRR